MARHNAPSLAVACTTGGGLAALHAMPKKAYPLSWLASHYVAFKLVAHLSNWNSILSSLELRVGARNRRLRLVV